MTIELLSLENVDKLVAFEQQARDTEPDVFFDALDSEQFRSETVAALQSHHFASARCMLCIDDIHGRAIGRLDFSILSSFAFGGDLRAYVDWIYVLKAHRHKGVAGLLFSRMEAYLASLKIDEYFLIAAENQEAQGFYRHLKDARIQKQDVLTKKVDTPRLFE